MNKLYKRYRVVTVLAVICVVVAACLVTAFTITRASRTRRGAALAVSPVAEPRVISGSGTVFQTNAVDLALVNLRPTGFEPAELTRPSGKFLFGVNNRTGVSDLTFELVDEAGGKLDEKHMVREAVWRKLIEPAPGHYLLRVTGHPEWQCSITISPT